MKTNSHLLMPTYWWRLLVLAAVVWPAVSGWTQSANQKLLPGHVSAAVQGLTPAGRLPAAQNLHLAVGLPLRDPESLTHFLQGLYDPNSTNYHHYLTASQFTEKFGPTLTDYQRVIDFAKSNGLEVATTHDSRLVLDLRGKVSDVERTFRVKIQTYQHPTEPRTFYAPDAAPSVDASLPIQDIVGLSDYALLHPASRKALGTTGGPSTAGSGPGGNYMGYDFRNAYAPGVSLDGTGQIIGLFEAEGYYANDILAYENLAGLPNVPVQNILIDSFSGIPGTNTSEASLDIETAISMAPGLASVIVFEGPNNISDWLDILDIMSAQTQIKQFSCSWGYDDGANPNVIMDAVFQKMAAQGQSFLQASGDGDAWVNPVAVPSASPYVTSVGGTSLTMSSGAYASETVWNQGDQSANAGWPAWFANGNGYWGSGGGTSTVYSIPAWQQNVSMAINKGSTTMRNIPDVALTAEDVWVIYNNGDSYGSVGTSAAAPLWAGFIALVNQQAAAHGNPAVGFINPAIYAIGEGGNYTNCFHDITAGNNTNGASPNKYYAEKGYDLCTGWGTPAGQPLIDALSPIDALGITPTARWFTFGPVGGPFTNSSITFLLTNTSSSNLNWACVNTSLWLNVTPTNGTLAAGGAKAVVFSLKSAATNLPAGNYTANTLFTNTSDHIVQNRQSTLLASPRAIIGTYAATLLSLNPVAYWQLNETNLPPAANVVSNVGTLGFPGNGFPFDEVVQGATGIVKGCYTFSNPGLIDHYQGSHVLVTYNSAFNPAGPFSVEFWARPKRYVTNFACAVASIDETQNGQASRMGWILYEGYTNQWLFRVGNFSGYVAEISGGTVQTNAWQHVAGVYDGTNVTLYLNGARVAGPTAAGGFSPNTNEAVPLCIGATSLETYTFDGSLDELAFFANALSSNSVSAHYHAATTNNAGYGNQILAGQPVGYWHFDEPTNVAPAANTLPLAFNLGSLSDLCDGAYQPGSLPGVAGITNTSFGSANLACSFLADSYIDVPGTWLGFAGPITLIAWFKTPLFGQGQSIASLGSQLYRLTLDGSGYPHFADGTQTFGDLIGPNPVNDNQWHELVGMYDGINSEYLYVDGQLVAQSPNATASPTENGNDFWIGGDPDPGALQYFNGMIDDVAIFTNTLTAGQVLSLFSAGASGAFLKAAANPAANGAVTLTLASTPGKTYLVEYCTNLAASNWSVLGNPATATNSTLSISNVIGSDMQRFYRALQLP
jgi:hypothetical protein